MGAVRDHLWLIGRFRERITRYEAPYVTEYVVERSLPPSRHELGRMTCTEAEGGTLVRWRTRAEIPVPLVGGLLTRRLARPVITRTFGAILAAADAALRTDPHGLSAAPAVSDRNPCPTPASDRNP
ncbi:hypothetical protein RCO28_22685 [Streptomyces sp. LHD-70]|uniref:SRPBCC family protein n=1 Tax=Streptomyces sp. LHD-70 TaxID=3072140 RepID=UPI00280ED98A|nr:SRPBCC family protein [Streptomyces sp. LHD-70]MDQ8705280.1 hypothetical protein [Streptomyces sp. LHD-70]